jgi:hypothetical protein
MKFKQKNIHSVVLVSLFIIIMTQMTFGMFSSNKKQISIELTDSKKQREDSLFIKAIDILIEDEKEYITTVNESKKVDSIKRPLQVVVFEEQNYRGAKCYRIVFSDQSLSEAYLPTRINKHQNLFICYYSKNRKQIHKDSVPNVLLEESEDGWRNESEWILLVCNKTKKTLFMEIGIAPFVAVKQLREFSCKNDNYKSMRLEKANIDTVVLKKYIEKSIKIAK